MQQDGLQCLLVVQYGNRLAEEYRLVLQLVDMVVLLLSRLALWDLSLNVATVIKDKDSDYHLFSKGNDLKFQ
jgi:hypothetical protein